ncbi:hypothetical protein Vretifemale_5246, partial [Volvox reticuliferus]
LVYTTAAAVIVAGVNPGIGAVGAASAQQGMFPEQLRQPETQLQGVTTGSLGAVLVLSLMVAAAGGMPPDLMVPISSCLHTGWLAMGAARFRAWLRTAAMELSSPPTAAGGMVSVHTTGVSGGVGGGMAAGAALPWARLKVESLVISLNELWSEECERDLVKFKRSLKALCGGKKKATGAG